MNKINLQNIRDILLIWSIYLFFSGWVYVYFFYEYFGLSLSSVKIDFTSYLVYSFVVLTSFWGLPLFLLLVFFIIYNYWLKKKFFVLIAAAVLMFPLLYFLSQTVAIKEAKEIRSSPNVLREIHFTFRTSDLSTPINAGNNLYLLGENDKYFIVLQQPPVSKAIGMLPIGSIYFLDKGDVLLATVVIR